MNSNSLRLAFFPRVAALSLTTLTELVRLKVFYFLLIFALLVIGNSAFMAQLSFQEEFQMLKDVSLGAMSVFTALLAILGTAMLLPKDIEERTIYTILAKPVPRYEYLLGKLGGMLLLLFLSVCLMSVLFLAVLWLRENAVIAEAKTQLSGAAEDEIAFAVNQIRAGTFSGSLGLGIIIIFMKAALLSALTLLISTFSTSSIFTMITATAVYFIGHLQSTAREIWLAGMDSGLGTKMFLALIALVFPDLQAFSLADDIVAGTAIPVAIFWQTFVLGWFYVAVYYFVASFIFAGREL